MTQHIHIVGICGTFMGSLARLAKEAGFKVSGCDSAVYPPMSTQLEQAGIDVIEGYSADQLKLEPDIWVIGNVVSRGNELMEAILNRALPYTSGPQWLADNILRGRWVLAVAGTHGKTTTSSMLAWILDYAGFAPGFLIGGVPQNFSQSARLGTSDFFVIEADEYDTAFFDKRSKFVHYRPQTLILNNLEYDHADIFEDLAAIQKQFHHLLRTVSGNGLIISPKAETAIQQVLAQGCWTETQDSGESALWDYKLLEHSANDAEIYFCGRAVATLSWQLDGRHNLQNAVHAIAAARHIGIEPALACEALGEFGSVARRMQLLYDDKGLCVYDDFAHHPTAIALTLEGLKRRVGDEKILAVIEPRSNTMKLGVHAERLKNSAELADLCFWIDDQSMPWSLSDYVVRSDAGAEVFGDYQSVLEACLDVAKEQLKKRQRLHIVMMSNGGFGGLPKRLAEALKEVKI
ncbi:UDP-N-acetylmuramate:L-alanyl-gamma-D-glutamyl-meso-diaminopimelate ligase [Agaribacterium haliotis]|uniref:UDP-N-acetylmuramate:L-alanyl-gamma-D-glutamyl- meso-diaminopimelate ligase n=1 Tax=Agaribacterium haliotis TaxID=2013869 RepID=UPI001958CCEE|nr:UDP-N-acetylmuramate:L-alanyl-gamma-D-glutamyl-meso-diaminopimelate ligase [Agaribacterium haliotis]